MTGSQIIVNGKSIGNMDAMQYHARKPEMMKYVLESFARLSEQYDYIVIEGAGSPAEINLRDGDIANMGFAEAIDCPVLLIADIEQGGVFAHLYGTLALLSRSERKRVLAMVINKFRGDPGLLISGIDWLEKRTGKSVLGVLPYLTDLNLEAEDSLSSRARKHVLAPLENQLRICVVRTPRVSNDTDFDAICEHPQVHLQFVDANAPLPPADLVILPGSKNVRDDLNVLLANGWKEKLLRHVRYGGKLLGICGGFQMLGRALHDPLGIESSAGSSSGFGFLELETTLEPEKRLALVSGCMTLEDAPVSGYEIHMGVSQGHALQRPFVTLEDRTVDGALSEDDSIAGTYLHGLFDTPEACKALLRWAGLQEPQELNLRQLHEARLDNLADALDQHLHLEVVERALGM